MEKYAECTDKFLRLKKTIFLNDQKYADSNTAPKKHWTTLNPLLYYNTLPAIPPLSVDGKFFETFVQKQTFFITFSLLYAHL